MTTYYWVGGDGNTNDSSHYATSSGGTGGAGTPGSGDNVICDNNSHSGSYTITVNATWTFADITITAPSSGNVTLAGSSAINFYGNWSNYSGLIRTYTGAITFKGTSAKTITVNGVSLDSAFTQDGVSGKISFQDTFVTAKGIVVTKGHFDKNNQNITCLAFTFNNSNTKTIELGSGYLYLTGNNATIWQGSGTNTTIPDNTTIIEATYSGATGTRTFSQSSISGVVTNLDFKISGGTDTVSTGTFSIRDLDFTGFSGTWASTASLTLKGKFTFSPTMSRTATNTISLSNTSGVRQDLTFNGLALAQSLIFNGSGGLWSFVDDCVNTGAMGITNGHLSTNGKNLTTGTLVFNSGTKTFDISNSTVTLTGTGNVFNATDTANLTFITTGSKIIANNTSATAKTFIGGGLTFDTVSFVGDNITITGNNSYKKLKIDNAGQTTGLLLTAGTTQTVTKSITSNGSSGNLCKILSTSAGVAATISKASGKVVLDYMSIKDITATGGAEFYARHSTNVSGNSTGSPYGWYFTDFVSSEKNPYINAYWTYQEVFNKQVFEDLETIEDVLYSLSTSGSGANTGLSNLTTTSINQNLIPQSSKTLGDSSNRWSGLWSTTGNFSGDLTVDTNVFFVDTTNNRVGINNASPSVALDVTGAYNQSFAGTTTNGFNITGDSVTTGTLARIISNASNTSARSILSVIQDHASATSAIAVSIQQDSSSNALFLDHNLAGSTIEIDADDNSATAMYGLRMNIANAGAGLEYAFRFDGSEIVSSAVGGSQDKKVRVSIAGTDYFVPLYTA